MGSRQDRIMLDNIWFIGHFYHDSYQRDCCLRKPVYLLDEPYVLPYFGMGENVELPEECPLKKLVVFISCYTNCFSS